MQDQHLAWFQLSDANRGKQSYIQVLLEEKSYDEADGTK